LLTAAHQAAQDAKVSLPRAIYLTGFSQGAQVALALDHVIETESDSPWKVVAVAPIADPYDLSGTEFPGLIEGSRPTNSAYLAYLAIAYVQIYGTERLSDIFTAPYNSQIPSLFNDEHSLEQIAQILPPPGVLFRQEFRTAVAVGTHPFASQLRANDTLDVRPRAAVRLFHGGADIDVVPRNTLVAATAMKAAGVQVASVDLGERVDHPGAFYLGMPTIRAWFDELAIQR
jgi:acetyl esterase/lipase